MCACTYVYEGGGQGESRPPGVGALRTVAFRKYKKRRAKSMGVELIAQR
jgi:hypothetical protein